MAANAGTVTVQLKANDRGFGPAFDRAEKRVGSFQRTLGGVSVAAKAFLGTAAVFGAIALTKELFRVGAAAVEIQNKFDTVFGSMAGDVEGFAKDFGRMAGLSKTAAKDLIATTGAIAQGMGFARAESVQFSKQVLTLAGDLGSFNNLPTADVAFRIQAALTGERESMKRLGVVITEAEVQQRALLDTGKSNVSMLTQQDKATATLAIITAKAGVAIGDLARTQDSAANTGKRVAAQMEDIKTTLAVGLLPALAAVMTFLDQNLPAIERWADRVARAFQTAFDPSAIGLKEFEAEVDRQMQRVGAKLATQLLPTQENLEARRAKALADLRAAEAQMEGFSAFDKLLDTVGFKNLEIDAAKARTEIERIDRAISILSGKMIGLQFPGRDGAGFVTETPAGGTGGKALTKKMRLLGPASRGILELRRVPIEIEPYVGNLGDLTANVREFGELLSQVIGRELPAQVSEFADLEEAVLHLPVEPDFSFFEEGTLAEFTELQAFRDQLKGVGVAAGRDLILGLTEGTLSMGDLLRQTLSRVLDVFVTKTLDDVFELGSPSRLFVRAGEDLMAGLAIGIGSGGPMVQRAISDFAPDVVPGPRTARATRPAHTLNMNVSNRIEAMDSQSFEHRLDQHSEAITGRMIAHLRRSQGLRSVLDGR